MKKILVIGLSCFVIVIGYIYYSNAQSSIEYSDDLVYELTLFSPEIKILQLTDFHLLSGFDHQDRRTFKLIEALIQDDDYDLIVITGDLTMSPFAPWLMRYFVRFMESFETPWTFVFGNHESDLNSYQSIINHMPESEYLYFKVGPQLTNGGYGNFKISFIYEDIPIYHAYFLDTKAERTSYSKIEGKYDYLSEDQVSWYEAHVRQDLAPSSVFMHMPLRQYMDPISYVGIFNEKQVYAQGVDTGFFEVMKTYAMSHAVFVGHDHLNDFYTMVDDIMLAYGRVTGFNAYGNLERGARLITINENQALSTRIILESEVIQ
ncbi:MAG: metallophosphoesterase [Acholeplasmataceae bacterium]